MKEIFKTINSYEDYLIGNCGTIISLKNNQNKILKPFLDSKKRYYMITLCKNGIYKKKLIHRLVAEHFCEKVEGKNVVNHIDHNTFNNHYSNLEWVTTQENVHHSYSTMSAIRNCRKCKLIYPDGHEFIFNSFPELIKHQEKYNLDFSETSLRNNGHSRGFSFVKL